MRILFHFHRREGQDRQGCLCRWDKFLYWGMLVLNKLVTLVTFVCQMRNTGVSCAQHVISVSDLFQAVWEIGTFFCGHVSNFQPSSMYIINSPSMCNACSNYLYMGVSYFFQ